MNKEHHTQGCATNIRCAVLHTDGICTMKNKCDCKPHTTDTGWEKELKSLAWRYVPGSGCANCWGDLHQGCESTCRGMDEAQKERDEFVGILNTIIQQVAEEERKKTVEFIRNQWVCDDGHEAYGFTQLLEAALETQP